MLLSFALLLPSSLPESLMVIANVLGLDRERACDLRTLGSASWLSLLAALIIETKTTLSEFVASKA